MWDVDVIVNTFEVESPAELARHPVGRRVRATQGRRDDRRGKNLQEIGFGIPFWTRGGPRRAFKWEMSDKQ